MPSFLDREMGGKPVPRPGLERNLRVVAQHQDALVEWTIGVDRDLGIGTFHRAHISAGIFPLRPSGRTRPGNDT